MFNLSMGSSTSFGCGSFFRYFLHCLGTTVLPCSCSSEVALPRNTTPIMNPPALSKLMPNHLTVREKWRESFIFHISYKSKFRTFDQEVTGERGQHINIHQHSCKHTPILSHSMFIQRQMSTKTSDDGKYRHWFPILQRQFVDSNLGLSFGTFHGSWKKYFVQPNNLKKLGDNFKEPISRAISHIF